MTWMAMLKGWDASLLEDLGPLSDVSVLIFMIDDAVSQHHSNTHSSPCGHCAEGLFDSILYTFLERLAYVILDNKQSNRKHLQLCVSWS